MGGWFLLHSPLFSARSVTVTGNVHETAAQVEAQAGLAGHPPLLDVNTGARRRGDRAAALGALGLGHVSWPDGVHIVVAERGARTSSCSEPGGQLGDAERGRPGAGRRTARPPGLHPARRCPQAPGAPGSVGLRPGRAGLRVASTLPPSFAAQVTAVTVEPAGWVQLAMTTPILVDIGTATQLTAKYEDVTSILAGATLHNGDVIDVSVPDAPTVTGTG